MNFVRLAAAGALLVLGGCVDPHALACCTGQVFQLNTGRWTPNSAELAVAQKQAAGVPPPSKPSAPTPAPAGQPAQLGPPAVFDQGRTNG